MKDNYDFSGAVKNPFAGKIKGKYIVTIYYDFSKDDKTRESLNNEQKRVNEASQTVIIRT